MKRLVYLLPLCLCFLVLSSCKRSGSKEIVRVDKLEDVDQVGRFPSEGEFVANLQKANYQPQQIMHLGEVSREKFIETFNELNWSDQVKEANSSKNTSPSLGLRHNPTNNELGITVVGHSSEDYGFWLYYGTFGNMKTIEVLDASDVLPFIDQFFLMQWDQLEKTWEEWM